MRKLDYHAPFRCDRLVGANAVTHIRLKIYYVILFILGLSIYLAALASGTLLWSKIIYGLTVSLLFLAAIAARRGGPFWYGCAVVGWGYFLLGLGPWFDPFCNSDIPMDSNSINRVLITSCIISDLSHRYVPYISPGDPQYVDREQVHEFRAAYTTGIAHAMLTVLFALFGGLIAVFFDFRRSKDRSVDRAGVP